MINTTTLNFIYVHTWQKCIKEFFMRSDIEYLSYHKGQINNYTTTTKYLN